jgi:hypothetical protein
LAKVERCAGASKGEATVALLESTIDEYREQDDVMTIKRLQAVP